MKTKNDGVKNYGRRKFLFGVIPASCCLFSLQALSQTVHLSDSDEHKFDTNVDDILSYREHFQLRFNEFIQIMKDLSNEIGKDKVIEFLKKKAEDKGRGWANWMLENYDNNDFSSFIKYLDDPYYDKTLTFEVVEKTDVTCEIKVTECIWAETFRKEDAGDIGYAYICHGDFTHCQTFNKKIKMIRNQTLMQGHTCCNHRYVLET